jgi:hypothetical protein
MQMVTVWDTMAPQKPDLTVRYQTTCVCLRRSERDCIAKNVQKKIVSIGGSFICNSARRVVAEIPVWPPLQGHAQAMMKQPA